MEPLFGIRPCAKLDLLCLAEPPEDDGMVRTLTLTLALTITITLTLSIHHPVVLRRLRQAK